MNTLPSSPANRPERRFQLMCWFEDRAKSVVYIHWHPDRQVITEVRGRTVVTVADTTRHDDAVTIAWREDCTYSDDRRQVMERETARIHRALGEARVCDG